MDLQFLFKESINKIVELSPGYEAMLANGLDSRYAKR